MIKVEWCKNRLEFCMFLAAIFFGEAPEFRDLHYKAQADSDHGKVSPRSAATELGHPAKCPPLNFGGPLSPFGVYASKP